MELDDLGTVEVRRSNLGEAHHQHRADREVRHDRTVAAAELGAEHGNVVVRQASRADNRVHAVHSQPGHGDACGLRHGEVDDDIATGVGQRAQITGHLDAVTRLTYGLAVDRRNQLEVIVECDRYACGPTEISAGPDDTHLDLRHG